MVTEVGSMNLFTHWVTPEGKEQLITAPLDGTILPGTLQRVGPSLTTYWSAFIEMIWWTGPAP